MKYPFPESNIWKLHIPTESLESEYARELYLFFYKIMERADWDYTIKMWRVYMACPLPRVMYIAALNDYPKNEGFIRTRDADGHPLNEYIREY